MKTINLFLEDKEYDKLVEVKGSLTWKEFVFTLLDKKEVIENAGDTAN